jgi:hypothetical protein
MEDVKTSFTAGKAVIGSFGAVLGTVIGDWRTLPRTKPNFAINTSVQVGSYNLPIIISASVVPDSWWFYVEILRNMEVVGLAIYFLWKCQQLVLDTLGGA